MCCGDTRGAWVLGRRNGLEAWGSDLALRPLPLPLRTTGSLLPCLPKPSSCAAVSGLNNGGHHTWQARTPPLGSTAALCFDAQSLEAPEPVWVLCVALKQSVVTEAGSVTSSRCVCPTEHMKRKGVGTAPQEQGCRSVSREGSARACPWGLPGHARGVVSTG